MPAVRLIEGTVELKEFDLVGQDGETPFVRHVGLAAEAGRARRDRVSVHQMGPPLQSLGEMRADVQATADLSDDESTMIRIFVERHASEHANKKLGKGQGYCVHPHVRPVEEVDGTHSHSCFSCVGFALEAYRYGCIEPLDLSSVPLVDLDAICNAYPDQTIALQNPRLRGTMGLSGNGPWPVILCGYLVHALNRPPPDIRRIKYVADPADADFR